MSGAFLESIRHRNRRLWRQRHGRNPIIGSNVNRMKTFDILHQRTSFIPSLFRGNQIARAPKHLVSIAALHEIPTDRDGIKSVLV